MHEIRVKQMRVNSRRFLRHFEHFYVRILPHNSHALFPRVFTHLVTQLVTRLFGALVTQLATRLFTHLSRNSLSAVWGTAILARSAQKSILFSPIASARAAGMTISFCQVPFEFKFLAHTTQQNLKCVGIPP